MMYKRNSTCRVSGAPDLVDVLDLGSHAFTGIFPSSVEQPIPSAPLSLSLSPSSHLLQMTHTYDPSFMYGSNYGYQSGLNSSMVSHLDSTVDYLLRIKTLCANDVVLDIGSNDGTLLSNSKLINSVRVGIDPSAGKFAHKYPSGVHLIEDFFSDSIYLGKFDKASIITTISMFYDLEAPLNFARQVYNCLHDDGVWLLEQSYLPFMLQNNSFDTICHEHYEYYSLTSLMHILNLANFRIIDVKFNDINGGSFSILVAKKSSTVFTKPSPLVDWVLSYERTLCLQSPSTYIDFKARIDSLRAQLLDLLYTLKKAGQTVAGLGASTKGNVLLQYYGITPDLLPVIGDINSDKYNCFTPGTHIPIHSEDDVLATKPDYLLILPWHFKKTFLSNLNSYLSAGGRLIFPLPHIQIY